MSTFTVFDEMVGDTMRTYKDALIRQMNRGLFVEHMIFNGGKTPPNTDPTLWWNDLAPWRIGKQIKARIAFWCERLEGALGVLRNGMPEGEW